jgi:signal transduction histidine kinase
MSSARFKGQQGLKDAIAGTEDLVNVPGGRGNLGKTCREHGADRVAALGRIDVPGKCRQITPEAVRFEEINNPVDVAAVESFTEAAARITMIFESTTDSVLIVESRLAHQLPQWTGLGAGRRRTQSHRHELVGGRSGRRRIGNFEPASGGDVRATLGLVRSVLHTPKGLVRDQCVPSSQGLAIFVRDITEHKHALEARRLIEEQLHQSQKMESVGQLTGGVAHDFNNLLTVVSANLELIEDAEEIGKVRRFAAAARRATDRGTKLAAQLLAFSRRQILNPKLVNANQLISEFQGLIRQAVGGDCEVELRTDERLWLCHVEPPLLETALLNLALNARDAMPDGGVLKIETRNVVLDEGAVAGCLPGSYVQVSITDTGCGMPPEVRDRAFEPFFTTKEVGKGTGLGLSMVYGFVRQSGGILLSKVLPARGPPSLCTYLSHAKA